MKVLLVSNMFPPYIMGGAEMAAHSLSLWLAAQGHTVHVLTSAHEKHLAGTEAIAEGLTVERHYLPALYQIYKAGPHNGLVKAAWHAHDHFHLSCEDVMTDVIARFQPDIVNTHSLQGIGYNLLRAVGRSGLPCVQTLHDFGFLCINVNRFKKGAECNTHHLPCRFSTVVKQSYFRDIKNLAFWSPSAALLEPYRLYLPVHASAVAIPLPLIFENPPERARSSRNIVRLLYVGQVTPWKGVAFLTELVAALPPDRPFQLDIIGGGSDLDLLREKHSGESRITFHGKLAPEKVGSHMAAADLLLTPSLWFENAPLVISQAIQIGLPVLASHVGGLPELVEDHVSGRLLPVGDAVAWSTALTDVIKNPERLQQWRKGARELQSRFSVNCLGQRVLDLFEQTIHSPTLQPC